MKSNTLAIRRAFRVGCSGWQYKHWRGDFYPRDLRPDAWLEYYAQWFDTVELNNTFYRLPSPADFASWRTRVPKDFQFAVKASRYLTHMKKLKDPADPLRRFFEAATSLGRKLGPVLYQLPPRLPLNMERLTGFLQALPRRRRQAMEFRHASWHVEPVYRALERFGVALCLHDSAAAPSPRIAVGPFIYVRFHGDARHSGRYADATLRDWADWLTERRRERKNVYVYFNNDVGGHAPRDAMRLRSLLAECEAD